MSNTHRAGCTCQRCAEQRPAFGKELEALRRGAALAGVALAPGALVECPKVLYTALDASFVLCILCAESCGRARSVSVQRDGAGSISVCAECLSCCVTAAMGVPVERDLE